MNDRDTKRILAMIEANWQPVRNQQAAIELWSSAFRDDPAEIVEAAVMALIQTSDMSFRPTVGMVRRKMADIVFGEKLSETEAWLLIKGSFHEAQEEPETLGGARRAWEKLPEDLQKLVSPRQLLDWNGMDSAQIDTVIQSNFMRSYRETRERQYAKQALMRTTSEDISRIRGALGLYKDPEKKPALPQPKKLAYEKPEWMIRREENGERF